MIVELYITSMKVIKLAAECTQMGANSISQLIESLKICIAYE